MAIKYSILAFLFVFGLAACDETPRFRKDSVWDLYDIRTPVPAHSDLNSRAAQQDPRNANLFYHSPEDNDAYYTPPGGRNFGVCGEGNIGSFSCD